jgi:deoxyribodipyrimidine photo-lyase
MDVLRRTTIVLFTRDLRVHDHPAVAAASMTSAQVVPLFLLDDSIDRFVVVPVAARARTIVLEAWKAGRTGYPLVDAAMRRLATEGWLPDRARLVTAAFLVKTLELGWRLGAQHFSDLLIDGDIANNSGNWQWVAGTGNDTRQHRGFDPVRQALRLDPERVYVRRWVPELARVPRESIHTPWRLDAPARGRLDYPAPLVDPEPFDAPLRGRGAA